MGGLCSKSANEDNFSRPGRVLGSSSGGGGGPANSNSNIESRPIQYKISASGPGRTVGTSAAAQKPSSSASAAAAGDPRSAAARAAEERAAKSQATTGKLSGQLAAQKRQTQNQLLQQNSNTEREARIADANAEARNWN